MSITIDKEFETLIPPLTPDEFQQLEENCVREGIRDSLITWNGILVDGHNRYKIAIKHGLRWSEKEMDFTDRDEVVRWIILNQFGRRNLSAYDRSVLALKLKPMIAKKAEQNLHQGNEPLQKSVNPVNTQKELAKVACVSHDTIHKVEVIEKKATPEVKQQIHDGKKSINSAFNEINGRGRKQIDLSATAHLEKAEELHEGYSESKSVSFSEVTQDKEDSTDVARNRSNDLFTAIKKILFLGAGNYDYSVINTKTIDANEIRRLQGELSIAISILTRIKNEIGSK